MAPFSHLPALRAHVRLRAEDRPGIYRMLGADGAVIYVGKSVRVRARVLSYFNAPEGDKAELLMREARAVEWEYVPNEFAALLGEMRLIQRHRPRWNVQHKRRPHFCFVKLSGGPAPRRGHPPGRGERGLLRTLSGSTTGRRGRARDP